MRLMTSVPNASSSSSASESEALSQTLRVRWNELLFLSVCLLTAARRGDLILAAPLPLRFRDLPSFFSFSQSPLRGVPKTNETPRAVRARKTGMERRVRPRPMPGHHPPLLPPRRGRNYFISSATWPSCGSSTDRCSRPCKKRSTRLKGGTKVEITLDRVRDMRKSK